MKPAIKTKMIGTKSLPLPLREIFIILSPSKTLKYRTKTKIISKKFIEDNSPNLETTKDKEVL